MRPEWETPPCEQPISMLIWASRIYIHHVVNQASVPEARLLNQLARSRMDTAYPSLAKLIDHVLVGSRVTIQLHQPQCPCMSQHEQAVIMALRSAQTGNVVASSACLHSVLQSSTVRCCEPLVRRIAMSLTFAEAALDADGVSGRSEKRRHSARNQPPLIH